MTHSSGTSGDISEPLAQLRACQGRGERVGALVPIRDAGELSILDVSSGLIGWKKRRGMSRFSRSGIDYLGTFCVFGDASLLLRRCLW